MSLRNCYAKLYVSPDVLEAGFPSRADEVELSSQTPVYQAPAFLSTPSKTWQAQAALESNEIMNLHLQSRANLNDVNVVVITDNVNGGTWYTQQNGVNGDGVNWNLLLVRRPIGAA